ncbi:MAG: hypothetical protein HY302_06970 [Opitutae bacterium]|nr:hypothetical protein [Opitutae bacterium]
MTAITFFPFLLSVPSVKSVVNFSAVRGFVHVAVSPFVSLRFHLWFLRLGSPESLSP